MFARAREFVVSPAGRVISGGIAAAIAMLVVFYVVVVRGGPIGPDVGGPYYPPFGQEWTISYAGQDVLTATLEWTSCDEWTYEERAASGTVLGIAQSRDTTEDGACHIPGVWFLPIHSYRGNPNQDVEQVSPQIYERAYRRSCGEVEGWSATGALPNDFCAKRDGTFEDLTRVEFDPVTEIPMRYAQYVDGILVQDRRATSLTVK